MTPAAIAVLVTLFAGIAFLVYFFFGSFAFGAGYEPTSGRVADEMIRLADPRPSELVVDIGAGTGALALRVARRRGARVRAVEIDPVRALILSARRRTRSERERVRVTRGNLFQEDLRSADVVFAFLWPSAMARLRSKLERELRPGARIVSHCHPVPGWVPYAMSGSVYAYRLPDCRGGDRL